MDDPPGNCPSSPCTCRANNPRRSPGSRGGCDGRWLPADPVEARRALTDLWQRAAHQRVEVACSGGLGRTGTALACLASLDGVPGDQAVGYIREHYNPRAIETPWQRRFVARFRP